MSSWVGVPVVVVSGALGSVAQAGGSVTTNADGSVTIVAIGAGLVVNGLITTYNSLAVVGAGVPYIVARGRPAQQVNATVTVVTYAGVATDQSYEVTVNVNVTVSTTVTMTVTLTYTDEANVARTLTVPFFVLAGTLVQSITTAQGNIAYESMPIRIRAKASTAISVQTAGTVTAVTYTCEADIKRVS